MEPIKPFRFEASTCASLPSAKDPFQGLFALLNRLQTTLQVEGVLSIFSEEVGPLFSLQGLGFRDASGETEIALGRKGRHRCSYRLTLDETPLGELTCYRSHPFKEGELAQLEKWLCTLVYPLRNALLYRQALQLSLKDPLTGVGNRAAMEEAIRREVEFSHRYRVPLAFAILDIDHFKQVNDRYGHLVGDCILKHLAERIRRHVRKTDLIFRYGGEEFAILLNADIKGAAKVAERIRKEVESQPYVCKDGQRIAITVSIGIADLAAGEAPLALFDRADKALYAAKRSGRNRLTLASSP